jgi:O-antigen ligase
MMQKITSPGNTMPIRDRGANMLLRTIPAFLVGIVVALGLLLGIAMGVISSTYAFAMVMGACAMVILIWLRQNAFTVALIVAMHILVDTYLNLGIYQIALLMALILLFVCYIERSTDHPWTGPRLIWLWILFLVLNIYPTINGGAFSLTNAIASYLNLIFSAFIIFWLGNIIAKDASAMRRVFQVISFLAALIAIHTIIETTTGKFLFETTNAEIALAQYANFHAQGAAEVSRSGSFFINPNGNGLFLATSVFLSLGLFIESKKLWAKTIYLLEALLILVALLFTYSAGSWVAVLVGTVIFLFMVGHVRYIVLLLVLILTLAVIIPAVFPLQTAALQEHASNQAHLSDHIGTWQTAIKVIEAFPLFGVGLGSQAYLVRAESYRRLTTQASPQTEPDISYLQWGATSGIPVMLLFLLLLGYVFRFSWHNWQTIDILYRPLIGGGLVALIALSINSLVVDGWTAPGGIEYLGWLIGGMITSPLITRSLYK